MKFKLDTPIPSMDSYDPSSICHVEEWPRRMDFGSNVFRTPNVTPRHTGNTTPVLTIKENVLGLNCRIYMAEYSSMRRLAFIGLKRVYGIQ